MPRSSRDTLVLAVLVLFGAAVRVALARGDLWLDELWSLSFARQIAWPWHVVTAIHHDNNHPLNTLALYLTVKAAGAHAPAIVYRLIPLLAGVATIPLLYWTERRQHDPLSRVSGMIAAILCAGSFLAILYSSEARGYAPAAFFAVLAFAMVRTREMTTGRDRALFAIVCALGLLSHLTFLFVYAGLAAWTFARFVLQRRDLRSWMALHQLPLVAIAGIYLVDARKLVYGGGPAFSVLDVVTRVLALTAGGQNVGVERWSAMLRTVVAVVCAIWLLVRARDDEWIFFVTTLVVAPALMFLVYEPRYLDVRYFFVLVPFLWILGARTLAFLSTQAFGGRVFAVAFLLVALVGNLAHVIAPLRDGRGHYRDAIATMANMTPGELVTVGSDHDFSNRLVIDYYGEERPSGKTIVYVPSASGTPGDAEWYLTRSNESADQGIPLPVIALMGRPYVLVRSFTYGGISGWTWHLYREAGKTSVQSH
jgi:hypothetical protein